ncbi:TonB-dependent siderophore receptor [Cellvibrio sp. pealriver]|uniref:TonB-dependent siderophore receptor n=1 Tax=Cellvibrio sp. pealriver TaxID=1622269 RepID=UPI00066FD956|nr:TonB-dependent siderophore receptor [Cellvibrio sp. pealriver]
MLSYRVKTGFKTLPLVAAIHAVCVSGAVYAQDSVETVLVTGQYTVADKVDTATGLGLTLFETPQSVSIMTEQRIIDQNLNSVADVVTQTVGVSSNNLDTTRNTFNARGFEIDKYQIDGVPQAWSLAGDSGETIADVSIYERIEVVRGATGLLTGAGDPSASINLVRKHATATELTGYVNAGVGRWDTRFISGDLSTPLTANGAVRARIVVKKEVSDTYMTIPEDDRGIIYGVIDADLGANTSLSVGSSYQESNPKGSTWGALPAWFSDGTPTDWDQSVTTSADWTYWDTTNENSFVTLAHQFANGWEAKVSYNHTKNTADTKLLYLSGTVDKATGEFSNAPFPYMSAGYNKQDSVDVQLKGTYNLFNRDHEFVVGALDSSYETETANFTALSFQPTTGNFFEWDGSYPEPTFSADGFVASQSTTDQDGYYAATRLSINDDLKFIAGGRVSSWQQNGFDWSGTKSYGNDDVVVPYAGLTYTITERHNVYTSFTEIFKPQNARDADLNFLDPVEGTNIEAGLKSSFFDGALQTAVAVFQIQQDNVAQVAGFLPPVGSAPPEFFYRGAKGVESKGFELEAVGYLTPNWNLSAGYAQFKAEDAAGTEVNTDSPRKKLNVFTTYEFTNALDGLTIGGGASWESERRGSGGEGLPALVQDAYTLASVMVRYNLTDDFALQFNVDNLTDEHYYGQVGFYSEYTNAAPRNYTLSATYSF